MLFYERAANILQRLAWRKGSVKSMTVGNPQLKPEEKRKMYALIYETLKYASPLSTIIEHSGILEKEEISIQLALVLVHDLLFTRSGLQHKGADQKLNIAIRKHKAKLVAELEALKQERGVGSNIELVPKQLRDAPAIIRYVRVNLLKLTVNQVVGKFEAEGYRLLNEDDDSGTKQLLTASKKQRMFVRDPDLPDLLAFPPGTDFQTHPLYLDGSIILQDKASCMPAHVVAPPAGSTVLDACAAPGNKTSHLASLMANKGRVFAFDKDARRLDTLVQLTDKAGCKIIKAQCMSFLEVDPLDPKYESVEYVLLDPSCSGSGIVNRQDELVDAYVQLVGQQSNDKRGTGVGRAQALAEFQLSVVLHAMRFPNVKRISYSTCSIHVEENEGVVSRVLESQGEFGLAPADQVVPTWNRRGLLPEDTGGRLTKEQAACVVRTLPEDGINGFFVAGFVRQKPANTAATRKQLEELRASLPTQKELEPVAPKKKQPLVKENKDNEAKRQKKSKEPRAPPVALPKAKSKGRKRAKRKTSVAAV